MGGRIGNALQRKFGPLPAWAWAGVLGGALYFYRRSKSGAGPLGAANVPGYTAADTAPDFHDPLTVSPGDSVYDPNSGALLTAPDGLPQDSGQPAPSDGGGGDGVPAGGSTGTGTRRPKHKPRHAKAAANPLHRPRALAHRARATVRRGSGARTLASGLRKAAKGTSKAKTRGTASGGSKPGRGRVSMPRPPALRQRTAAHNVVHQNEQKVGLHPDRAAVRPAVHPAAAAPAPRRPAPTPQRAPARRRGR